MEIIKKPRGTMDIMAPDIAVWSYIESAAREVAELYGFTEIRTPTFEELKLFSRGVGESTDVVQKEMYTFEDREERKFALRPEGTASVVRAIIENGKTGDAMPLKYFYLINCFRYEKPQAGRSREFYQFGVEMFGSKSPAADFTVISVGHALLTKLGIKNVVLKLNSIGCPECRPAYRETLVSYLHENEDKLCETCRERLLKNPLRVLDCKNGSCTEVALRAPKTLEHLCPDCEAHMKALEEYLRAAGIPYEIDSHIVRGLDYYTRTVFEFVAEGIGAQSTVCGGGRYDGLVSELGGPSLPGLGFGMGLTRLILAMKESGAFIPEIAAPDVYFAPMGEAATVNALTLTEKLRSAGIKAECDVVGRSLKAQMKYADKTGVLYTAIIGDSEIEKGEVTLRNMKTGEQTPTALTPDAIIAAIRQSNRQ